MDIVCLPCGEQIAQVETARPDSVLTLVADRTPACPRCGSRVPVFGERWQTVRNIVVGEVSATTHQDRVEEEAAWVASSDASRPGSLALYPGTSSADATVEPI